MDWSLGVFFLWFIHLSYNLEPLFDMFCVSKRDLSKENWTSLTGKYHNARLRKVKKHDMQQSQNIILLTFYTKHRPCHSLVIWLQFTLGKMPVNWTTKTWAHCSSPKSIQELTVWWTLMDLGEGPKTYRKVCWNTLFWPNRYPFLSSRFGLTTYGWCSFHH